LSTAVPPYAYEQASFSPTYVDAVYRGEGLELWRSASEDHTFSIRLMIANDNLFEGCLSVVAFVDGQRVCLLSFSYVDAAIFGRMAGTMVFVTRKQSGRHPEQQQAFSRAFNHSSPPYFCVAALAGVALATWTPELAAIRHEAHPTYLHGHAEALRTSYDECWEVFGATELDEKASRIPVPPHLGDLTEVASSIGGGRSCGGSTGRKSPRAPQTIRATAAPSLPADMKRRPPIAARRRRLRCGGRLEAGEDRGGGFLTGIDQSPDGTTRCVARTPTARTASTRVSAGRRS
jgi:hypothetical protein